MNKEKKPHEKKELTVCGVLSFALMFASLIFVALSFWYFYLSPVNLVTSLIGIIVGAIGVHFSKKDLREGKTYANMGTALNLILFLVSLMQFVYFMCFMF